jgi:hypothetical protein
MNRWFRIAALTSLLVLALGVSAHGQTSSRVGLGFHYWKALKDVDVDDVDEDGLGWLISYKLVPSSLLNFQGDVEMLPDGYAGSDKKVFAPQLSVIAGSSFYGAVGIGILYSDGDFADDPFYALRVGADIELLPRLFADVNVNYRFENWDYSDVKNNIDMDTLTLGAVVRLAL